MRRTSARKGAKIDRGAGFAATPGNIAARPPAGGRSPAAPRSRTRCELRVERRQHVVDKRSEAKQLPGAQLIPAGRPMMRRSCSWPYHAPVAAVGAQRTFIAFASQWAHCALADRVSRPSQTRRLRRRRRRRSGGAPAAEGHSTSALVQRQLPGIPWSLDAAAGRQSRRATSCPSTSSTAATT